MREAEESVNEGQREWRRKRRGGEGLQTYQELQELTHSGYKWIRCCFVHLELRYLVTPNQLLQLGGVIKGLMEEQLSQAQQIGLLEDLGAEVPVQFFCSTQFHPSDEDHSSQQGSGARPADVVKHLMDAPPAFLLQVLEHYHRHYAPEVQMSGDALQTRDMTLRLSR